MVQSSLTQNTRMGFLLVALLIAFTIVFSTVSAVTPPPPTGFSTGGLFAQYFENAATGSDTVTAVDILKDCPANTYMYGFITTGANFFTKKCRSATYIQAWNVNGNPGTTGANFLGTTDNLPLRIKTNSVERMYIGTDGKVGIGTNAPQAVLDVSGGDTKLGDVFGGVSGGTRAIWKFDNTFPNYGIFYTEGTPDVLSLSPSGGGVASPDLTIRSGNVGIGVPSPTAPLDIRSPIDSLINLTQPDAADGWNYIQFNSNAGRRWWMGTDSTGIFTIYRDGSAATSARIGNADLVVDNKLGIGYSNPGYPLDVNGSARINGEMIRTGGWRLTGNGGWGPDTLTVKKNAWDGVANDNYGAIAAGHGYYYNGLQTGGGGGWEANNPGEFYASSTAMFMGNVGIGTTSPGAKFTIKQLNDAWDSGIRLDYTGSANSYKIISDLSSNVLTIAANNLYTSSIVLKASNGNVGIGTSTPRTKLDVDGAITIKNGDNLSWGGAYGPGIPTIASSTAGGGFINFYPGGSTSGDKMRINANGNVGIGNNNPTARLDLGNSVGGVWSLHSTTPDGGFGIGPLNSGWIHVYSDNANAQPFIFNTDVYSIPGGFSSYNLADLKLKTNGTDRLTILATNGNLGIGTNAPQSKLDVGLTGNSYASIAGTIGNGEYAGLAFGYREDNSNYRKTALVYERQDGAARGKIHFLNNGGNDASSATLADSKMTIQYDGKVGIGTTAPGAKLDILGNIKITDGTQGAGRVLTSGADGTATWANPGTGMPAAGVAGQTLYSNGTNWVASSNIFNNNGNVGIGTATPGSKLDVNGDINSRGLIHSNNANGFVDIGAQNTSWVHFMTDRSGYYMNTTLAVNGQISRYGVLNQWADINANTYMANTSIYSYGSICTGNDSGTCGANNGVVLGGVNTNAFSNFPNAGNSFVGGNLGIGTSTPGAKLHVAGNIKIVDGTQGPGKVLTSDAAGLATWANPGTGMPAVGAAGQTIYSNGTNWVASSNIFNNNGNVGIGNSTPVRKLDISTGNDGLTIGQDADNSQTIQTYIDGTWTNRTTYAGGCCNVLKLQPDVGTVTVGPGGLSTAGTITAPTFAGNATTASAVPWSGITGKPSLFTYDGWIGNPGYDANTIGGNKSGFSYSNNAPHTGPLAHFDAGGYGLEFSADYNAGGEGISFRTRNGDAGSWNLWNRLITPDTIASYAPGLTGVGASGTWGINISGNATTATTAASSLRAISAGSYGSTEVYGSYNGWSGIRFNTPNSVLMVRDGDNYSGLYKNNNTWIWAFDPSGSLVSGSVPWAGITGKPTTVSTWTNDSGYITNNNPNYLVTAGNGNAICFWTDCTNYTISMGNGSLYNYGSVNDYSIKMQMDAGNTGRGFTWGRQGVAPIASLNSTSGDFQIAGLVTATSFIYSSDRTLKKDIIPLADSLTKILSLSGYSFTWKSTGKKDIGVIAQEVEKIYPDLVHTDLTTGLKSVEYGNLIAPIIEAIKSEQKTIEEQNQKIQSLEARLERLEAQMQK